MTMTTSVAGNSNCLVCSGPSNGICHFGVQCCRACASFFHRSIKERRNYTCRWDQNCRISNDHGLRNSCRACRLKKCLEMGMAEEKKRERKVVAAKTFSSPTLKQQEQFQNGFISVGSLQNALPTPSLITNNSFERQNSFSIPLTLQLEDSIRQYDNGLRAFSIVEGISTELADTKEVRLITQQELSRADRATALLIYAMICQQLPILRELSVNYRIKMLKEFCKQFVTFHRIFMTTQTFFDSTSPYVFIVPGGAIDRNMLSTLFAENQNEEEKEKINISMMERLIEFGKSRVCPLKVSHLEFAALTGIVFWNTVEKHLMPIIPFDQVRAQKDAFYGELFSIISNNYGSLPHQSVIRHSNLLEMLHQLNLLISDVDEMQIMAKIFMNLPDFWDDLNLPPADQQYIQMDDSVKQMDNSV